MSEFREMMKREQAKRDAKVLDWLERGYSKAEVARRLGITRQRAGQIAMRLGWKRK